ncbi:MAG: 1-acyl-sn-glycerol-3-phosphate acyltransferase [Bacteroidetes bacterium]|nr:MAG: 1-acyl-sn-glycerol-3-phosphate acyltransferase [Bacteroidota bacterium]
MRYVRGVLGLLFKVYVALVFSLTLLLFYLPINLLKRSERTKKKCFNCFVMWSWCFRCLCFVHPIFRKKSELPKGPYIIVANHSSYMDIFLMYSLMSKHPFLFLGKSEILKYPLVSSFFRELNIPVFRNDRMKSAKSFIQARKAIELGWSLVIFPEGGIPDDHLPKMIPFKDGAFKLAKAARVPIVPITFTNNYLLFSDPGDLLGPARPGLSQVYIHPYLSVEEMEPLSVQELSDRVFTIVSGELPV